MKIRVIVRDSNAAENTTVRYKIKVRITDKKRTTFFSRIRNSLDKLLNWCVEKCV